MHVRAKLGGGEVRRVHGPRNNDRQACHGSCVCFVCPLTARALMLRLCAAQKLEDIDLNQFSWNKDLGGGLHGTQ